MNKPYHEPLIAGGIYHLFNRAIGDEKLFLSEKNYSFFLQKYFQHTEKVCDTFCYCLLPNHFHLLIRIKSAEELKQYFKEIKKYEIRISEADKLSNFVMERFSNWLNSYTKAFNKVNCRKGGLFMDYTKRQQINNDTSFGKLVHYIHANPVHHGYCKQIEEWKFSSFHELQMNNSSKLLRKEVLDFFGNKEQFILFHKQPIELKKHKTKNL
jgi:putative transposase